MSNDESTNLPSLQNVPEALSGISLMQAISMACQCVIDVKIPTEQVRPVSQNMLVITDSGERKSASYSILQKQLQDAKRKKW